jgi:2,4-dienoyl-CoA reductase-like NADH-dependent reductase (Old Yellow Enzyme family)
MSTSSSSGLVGVDVESIADAGGRAAALFSSVALRCGVTVKNRLALAPMTNVQSHDDGSLSDEELTWLVRRARGGFGLIETCASHVTREGQGFPGQLGIFEDRLLPGLQRLASAVKAEGALSLVQIFHGGARSPQRLTGQRAFSASEQPSDPETPRAASEDEIVGSIAAFRDAALRAQRAGFDGVELHGAHGYLLGQFLSRTQNGRSDRWGGDLVGRARLLREAVRAVRAAVPAPFVVGVRISPEDFGQAKGLDLDESLQVASWLCEDGIDFLHVSLWQALRNTQKRPDEHAMPLFRRACSPDVRLVAAGSVWTVEEALALIEKGTDIVSLGRAAIANPDWPLQARDPSWSPLRPPLSAAELEARAVSPKMVNYLRNFRGFVRE